MENTCAVEGCSRLAKARGWCHAHYMRWRAHGDPGSTEIGHYEPRPEFCVIDGCDRKVYARDWCVHHYENNRLRGDPLTAGPGQGKRPYPPKWEGAECSVDGCVSPVKTSGLCTMHYGRRQKTGDPGTADRLRGERGQGTVNQNGYREIPVPGRGRMLEHRFVMEQIVGRPLETHEHVHHKNGKRADNRPENLELWVSSHPAGQEVHDLVRWAEGILMKYGTLVHEGRI